MDKCNEELYEYTRKQLLLYNKQCTEESQDEDLDEYTDSIRDKCVKMVTGAVGLLKLVRSMLPTQRDNASCSNSPLAVAAPSLDVDEDLEIESRKIGKSMKKRPTDESRVIQTESRRSNDQRMTSKKEKIKSYVNLVSQYGENRSKRKNQNTNQETHRDTKKLKFDQPQVRRDEKKKNYKCSGKGQSSNSSRYKEKANHIINTLLIPNPKSDKIRSIGRLKKDKTLLKVFLRQRRKLGQKRIPILTRKRKVPPNSSPTMVPTHSKSLNRDDDKLAGDQSTYALSSAVDLSQNKNDYINFTSDFKEPSEFKERMEMPDLTSTTADYMYSASNQTINAVSEHIYQPNHRQEPGSVEFNRSHFLDYVRDGLVDYNGNNLQNKDTLPLEEDNSMASYMNVFTGQEGKSLAHPDSSRDVISQHPSSGTLMQLENNHQMRFNSSSVTSGRNEEVIDVPRSKNAPEAFIELGSFHTNAVEGSSENLLDPVLHRHFQYSSMENDIEHTQLHRENVCDFGSTGNVTNHVSLIKSPVYEPSWEPFCSMPIDQYQKFK